MDVRVLGPVTVFGEGDVPVPLRGRSCRAAVALLALQYPDPVTIDELVEEVWPERLPQDPAAALQVAISRIRNALGSDRSIVERLPSAYVLRIERTAVDLARAADALEAARRASGGGDPAAAAALAGQGLGEWRGQPLVELIDHPFAVLATGRLHRLRVALTEVRNDGLLAQEQFAEVAAGTPALLAVDPWQETLVEQLMVAQHRSGHVVDALSTYAQFCSALQRDLGLGPPARLQALHDRILGDRPSDVEPGEHRTLPQWFAAALDADAERDPSVQARLLLALGEAQHHAGEPGWQETLQHAGELARSVGDAEIAARCVMGGAIGWAVDAGTTDRRRLALIDATLAGDGLRAGTRARLLATRATELTYTASWQERAADSDEAVRLARGSGEPATLLAVLNHRYNSTWTPLNVSRRVADLEEAVRLSDGMGHSIAAAITQGLLMACAVEAADAHAIDDHLARFVALGEELDVPMLRWGGVLHSAWRAVIDDELDRAEVLNGEAVVVGTRAGRPEAGFVGAIQLASIRWAQGRLDEVADDLGAMAVQLPHLTGLRSLHALAVAAAGDRTGARVALDGAGADGPFEQVPPDPFQLAALIQWGELAAELADRPAAERLLCTLAPYDGCFVFTGAAVFGPVAQALSALARVAGDAAEASRYEATAQELARRMPSAFFARRAGAG